ncbi:DNA repair protein RecO [Weissella cibaria]|uniref:DNA repair protein RecO n=1 Tax=Weissella cibaria TaxID=137591 RepID=A0A9Q8N9P8_9LACO|nr:DNA repair protein RecO [Weissella cibaria]QDG80318.1 DNA repair protein RecO [Weissella cibaria]QMU87490.1 DNA repair protein RecO [Weissella cibaria]TVV27730.1 DNA repair protein RecO [Weissella cibaria]TVV35856.1 DNA repair protein RecO [Weissella cibaria]TVV40922.1 DNA repair protein RecO [Weissella cibaria]
MAEVFDAIVMYQQDRKEKDLMVKMLTKQGGKRMFYIKNGKSKRYQFAADVQPLTVATFEGTLNPTGLSFINAVKESHQSRELMMDVTKNAYMTYILGLIDAAFVDNQPIGKWYEWARLAIEKIESGLDPQGIANFFEIKLLPAFGLEPTWGECVVCGRRDLPLDFSEKLNGTLCQLHWEQDEQRMNANPRSVRVLSQLNKIDLKQLGSLSLKEETKHDMARVMDKIYDDQVGVHLRAKSFIQQLDGWSQRLAQRGQQKPTDESK